MGNNSTTDARLFSDLSLDGIRCQRACTGGTNIGELSSFKPHPVGGAARRSQRTLISNRSQRNFFDGKESVPVMIKAASTPAWVANKSLSPHKRPGEEVISNTKRQTPRSQIQRVRSGPKSNGKARRRSRSKVGPTAPGPTAPKSVPTRPPIKPRRMVSLRKRSNKVGPTQPGPTQPEPSDDSSYTATSSDEGDRESKTKMRRKKQNMPSNWKEGWKGQQQIAGLNVNVEEKSGTISPNPDQLRENKVVLTAQPFQKYPKVALNTSALQHVEENEVEVLVLDDTQSVKNKRCSIVSGTSSVISILSDPPVVSPKHWPISKSTMSEGSISDMSQVESGRFETPSIVCVHSSSYWNDYMPRKSWASPHYMDYEEEPYDMHTGKIQRKQSRSGSNKRIPGISTTHVGSRQYSSQLKH
jgi:hypothetical protein